MSETKLHIKPAYFQGSYPPEHAGDCPVSVINLNNGNVIKVYLADLEQAEMLCKLIVVAPELLEACNRAVAVLTESKTVNGKPAVAVSILRDVIAKL